MLWRTRQLCLPTKPGKYCLLMVVALCIYWLFVCRCAAHLNMLCNYAASAYEKYGRRVVNGTEVQRGMLVNYESLPGVVPRALLPLFGIRAVPASWLDSMAIESKSYSKARASRKEEFTGDSTQKDLGATDTIRKYAEAILQPTFIKLTIYSKDALEAIMSSEEFDTIEKVSLAGSISAGHEATPGDEYIDWGKLAVMPVVHVQIKESGNLRKHSVVPNVNAYLPWAPFANTHDSKPVIVSVVNV